MSKISVIIVEDEPAALRHISDLLEKFCPRYYIMCKCENGQDALLKIKDSPPDLLITDIKMPVMNGIELLAYIKKEYPEIKTLLISGYRDFEYAQAGIQLGAFNYILKPISPKKFTAVLNELTELIDKSKYNNQLQIIHSFKDNISVSPGRVQKVFPHEFYNLSIIRKNSLPKRFTREGTIKPLPQISGTTRFYGRDEFELLYLFPANQDNTQEYSKWLKRQADSGENEFTTTVFFNEKISILQLHNIVNKIFRILDENIAFAHSQFISVDDKYAAKPATCLMSANILKTIEFYASNAEYIHILNTIKTQLSVWDLEKPSQLWLENAIHQILTSIFKYSSPSFSREKFEFMFEDAFFLSSSYSQLYQRLVPIVEYILEHIPRQNSKVDSPEYVEQITRYLYNHLNEPLSLQSLCSNFNLSQTYMSKLFRKYTDLSFGKYLLNLRINFAKSLMDGNPNILIREVSDLAGFSDQFYFSKMFKTVTSFSPSEYLSNAKDTKKQLTY